jgi:PKD repeat protein
MAEVIYADPVTEDILINEVDEIAGGEEAECDCCCDCETGGPTADFTSSQSSADPEGNACCVQFTDTSTAGECGEIVSWLWDFGDENTSTEQNPEHCYTGAGPWTATLTVTDAKGCTHEVEHEVTCPCNCATDGPEANFSFEQTDHTPCCIDFFDESTSDPDCGALTYEWDFGDGNTSTDQNPSHCYASAGPWSVTLTVTNAKGCSDSVVGPVKCITPCFCCNEYPPPTATATISGFSNANNPSCVACADINGTYTLYNQHYLFSGGDPCEYRDSKTGGACTIDGNAGASTTISLRLELNALLGYELTITIFNGLGDQIIYERTRACPANCKGTYTFTAEATPDMSECNYPATISVTIG